MKRSTVVSPCAALRRSTLALVVVALAVTPAAAQVSRREALEAQRAEKAKALTPYQPGKLESGLLWMEDSKFTTRLFNPYEGWYVHFGGLTKGGGLGMGPGYKNWLFNEQALFHTWFVGSVRNYWFLTTELTFPKIAGGKLEVGGHGYLQVLAARAVLRPGPRRGEGATGPPSSAKAGRFAATRPTSRRAGSRSAG